MTVPQRQLLNVLSYDCDPHSVIHYNVAMSVLCYFQAARTEISSALGDNWTNSTDCFREDSTMAYLYVEIVVIRCLFFLTSPTLVYYLLDCP